MNKAPEIIEFLNQSASLDMPVTLSREMCILLVAEYQRLNMMLRAAKDAHLSIIREESTLNGR